MTATGRLLEAYAALRREHDELDGLLAQIEAYQPDIAAKARAWVAQVDKTPGGADKARLPALSGLSSSYE